MDSRGKKELVPAKGEAILYVGNHSLECQVTGVSTRHLVLVSPEAANVGQFIRCMIKLEDLPQWIDGDVILVQQVQDLKGHRRQIWTLQFQSLAPPGESVLEEYVACRRHIGAKTGTQARVTPRTQKGVGAVGPARKTDTRTGPFQGVGAVGPARKTDTRTGPYQRVPQRPVRDEKTRGRGGEGKESTQKKTLAEELKDYLEDNTPVEEIYASALEALDKETKRR